jgi:hypothetical protein
MKRQGLLASAMAVCLAAVLPGVAEERFDTEIAPILQKNCVACHSAGNAQGKLALDSLGALRAGGASGAAVTPGNSAASSLYQRLVVEDRKLRMPFGGKALDPELVATIKNWIDSMESSPSPSSNISESVDFHRDIEPIFKASCYGCHSGAKPQSQLRLDSGPAALRGGLSGKVILPGDSKGSRLIHRVKGMGGEQRMPLRQEPLSDQQVALLERWIDSGAAWPGAENRAEGQDLELHWSYKVPKRPKVPAVTRTDWARNDIDRFVLARLEKEQLSPSKRASKETLIRRLSLDLIGLPPTPEEVDAFVSDNSEGAYEAQVDRLLASPRYGERWARPWLDWARYADSHGYEKDMPRVMWKYRDWVVEALNNNMPFDQFTVEQLAGDMLPNPTTSQLVATGFLRNSMFNEEGGVDKDEAHYEVLVDRVNTTATLWLGTTLACAQCHNHKFDPFTQKEYYQFYAFFNNSDVRDRVYGDTSTKYIEPELDLPTDEQAARRNELDTKIEALNKVLKTETPELAAARRVWEKEQVEVFEKRWFRVQAERVQSVGGSTLTVQPDRSILAGGDNPDSDTYVVEAPAPAETMNAVMLEAFPDESLPRGGPGRDLYGNFILSEMTVELNTTGRRGDWKPVPWTYAVFDDGRVAEFYRKPPEDPKPGWERPESRGEEHLWVVDASREDKRVARRLVIPLNSPAQLGKNARLRFTLLFASPFGKQGIGRFRIAVANQEDPEFVTQVVARRRSLLSIPENQRTEAQQKEVVESFLARTPLLKQQRVELRKLREQRDELGIATAMVMGDRPTHSRLSAPIRIRGSFLSPGEVVYADVPKVLHSLPEDVIPNRLGLAKWLVSKDNPLTARVMVNRLWETYFGVGLVETSEDFGSQGSLPSHPELLDWLAVEFMESGWNLKHMHKLIVMSATYQQDSKIPPALLENDPYNRLLARGPRFRMEAEMIRDVALAASGLLSSKIGGPSVYPYQPEGIWDIPYSSVKWEQSKGEDQFRRAIYTFLRRSSPYPSMTTFDAPSREVCTIRRVRTNTPLQALNGLNDPVFFDAARALASRVIREGGKTPRERATYAFRLLTARQASETQVNEMVAWYEREQSHLQRDSDASARIQGGTTEDGVPAPELAAWTLIANVLLNMDEAVTKE